jgi:hypothetical protein
MSERIERRHAPRSEGRDLVAWLSGAVHSPALVLDVAAGGVLLFPIIPMRVGQRVAVDLKLNERTIAVRLGVVVRAADNMAAVRFIDTGHELSLRAA